jgi:hypothetical protein
MGPPEQLSISTNPPVRKAGLQRPSTVSHTVTKQGMIHKIRVYMRARAAIARPTIFLFLGLRCCRAAFAPLLRCFLLAAPVCRAGSHSDLGRMAAYSKTPASPSSQPAGASRSQRCTPEFHHTSASSHGSPLAKRICLPAAQRGFQSQCCGQRRAAGLGERIVLGCLSPWCPCTCTGLVLAAFRVRDAGHCTRHWYFC